MYKIIDWYANRVLADHIATLELAKKLAVRLFFASKDEYCPRVISADNQVYVRGLTHWRLANTEIQS